MLKIRMQGTKRDINWFCRLLKTSNCVELLQHSRVLQNKGTEKYFRMYAEIQEKEIKEDTDNE